MTSTLSTLANDAIDLWFIDPATLPPSQVDNLSALLSAEELTKLKHYRHQATRHTALLARAISRLVLSHYTQTPAVSLTFTKQPHGKPELANNAHNIRFNLSHNDQLIVLAVCVNDEIGCDIESPNRKVNIPAITRRFFAPQEQQLLSTLQGQSQQQQFFEIWTLKEAFVKATGLGIALGLDSFYFQKSPLIDVVFNAQFPLPAQPWQFYQAPLKQQLLAICRASEQKQSVHIYDARTLLKNTF